MTGRHFPLFKRKVCKSGKTSTIGKKDLEILQE
jgi:hypothetical protein